MQTIKGKRALVTGAAKGIGRAIALALAADGAELYLLDIDEPALAEVVTQARLLGAMATGARCDVADSGEITAAVAAMLQQSPRLDILVNNAGVAYFGPTHAMSCEQWGRLLAINLLAPIQFTRELLPVLLAQGESHILNVCSVAGLVPVRKLAAYQVSKFGLVGLSQSLRAEYAHRRLGVTALCPGFVLTNIFQAAVRVEAVATRHVPPAWMCTTTEKVAARALRAIRRNQGVVPVTPLARILWFLQKHFPRLLFRLSVKRARLEERNLKPKATAVLPGEHAAAGSKQPVS